MVIGKTRTNQPVESDAGLDAKLVNLPLPATASQGGKVLAVNSAGTGYELKPVEGVSQIWFHGIELYKVSSKSMFDLHILNNTSELINTVAKFITWLNSINDYVEVPGNGVVKIDDTWYRLIAIKKYNTTPETYAFLYDTGSGYAEMQITGIDDYFDTCSDATNRIL